MSPNRISDRDLFHVVVLLAHTSTITTVTIVVRVEVENMKGDLTLLPRSLAVDQELVAKTRGVAVARRTSLELSLAQTVGSATVGLCAGVRCSSW